MAEKIGPLIFHDGYALDRETIYLASQEEEAAEESESFVAIIKRGSWKFAGFDDTVISVACIDQAKHGFFLGESGRILVTGFGRRLVESLPFDEALGTFLRIRSIGGSVVATGMSGQVFARLDGVWQPLDRGLRGTRQLDLEDVGGTALDNLYAVSAFGSMVHFDGNKWSDIALPTNRPLSGVKVVAADEVYACGDDGTVIRGSSSTGVWQLISLDSFDESFSAVERHGTALFVAHPDGLKTWDGSVWSDVDLGLEGEVDCQTLHSKDGYLFSFGYQTLLVHDGSTWARMVPPTTV